MSVASTYAEALYGAAAEARAVREVAEGLQAFAAAVEEVPDLRGALHDPELGGPQKKALVASLLEGAHRVLLNFVQVLVDRRRIDELPEMAEAFADLVARAEGRVEVEAVTAVPLSDELRSRLVERIQSETGREVSLAERVDPEIVGGLVLMFGGVMVDGSVRFQLADLRRQLTSAPVETAAPS
jgi:F-type H+-transporting ATPase subunit delta